jgi:MFS family permease
VDNVRLLGWLNFFVQFRFYAPLAIIYFTEVTGSYAQGALVLSAVMVAGAVLEIPTGVFSDRMGRRATMIASALSMTAAVFAYSLAGSLTLLLVGAVAEGLGRAFYSGTNQAMLYESLEDAGAVDRYAAKAGHMQAMYQTSAAIGALVGAAIVAFVSLRWAFWLSLLPRAACLVVAMRLVEPLHRDHTASGSVGQLVTAMRNTWRNRRLLRLLIPSTVIAGVGEASYQFQGALVALLWPAWSVGVFRSGVNGIGAASYWLSGRVISRFGITRTLFLGELLNRLIGVVAYVRPTVMSPLLVIVQGLPWGPAATARDAMAQQEFSPSERATMGSIASLARSMCVALFTVVVGIVSDHHGPAAGLLLCELVALAFVPMLWRLHRDDQRQTVTAQ